MCLKYGAILEVFAEYKAKTPSCSDMRGLIMLPDNSNAKSRIFCFLQNRCDYLNGFTRKIWYAVLSGCRNHRLY